MQLIAPTDAAAVAPPNSDAGMAQKAGKRALIPMAARENITIRTRY